MNIEKLEEFLKDKILFIVVGILICGCLYFRVYPDTSNNFENIDKEMRKEFKSRHMLELSEEPISIYCNKNEDKKIDMCLEDDYVAYYGLKDDLSYEVKIENGEDSFDEDVYDMRQELYKYIKSIKKGGFVDNYLEFFNNGPRKNYINSKTHLAYMVFDDDFKNLTLEEIKEDYKILQKAKEILKKNNKGDDIKSIEVIYMNDYTVKYDGWTEDNEYTKSYLKNSNRYTCRGHDCRYSLEGDVGSLSYDEYKEKVMNLLNNS